MISRIHRKLSLGVASVLAFSGCGQPITAGELGRPGILWSVDWSADGKLFAVGGEWVGVFEAETCAKRSLLSLDGSTMGTKVRWHSHRSLLAVSGGSREDTSIFNAAADHKIPLKTKEGTRGIAWNSTGELLATAGNDGSLQIWSLDGTPTHTTRQEKAKGMTGVAWHPAENKLITIGEFITLYDESGRILKQVRHRPDAKGFCLLLCVEWHPSGNYFVVGDYGNHDTGELPILQFWSADLRLPKTITSSNAAPFRNIRNRATIT